jgi:hypothetical protein
MPLIAALRRPRQENQEFKASLAYIAVLCLQNMFLDFIKIRIQLISWWYAVNAVPKGKFITVKV